MVQCSVVVVRVGLATNFPAVVLLHYASRSCRGLRVGMVIAGGLHSFVVTNRKLYALKQRFCLSCFPTMARMTFAARGHKSHMVFAALESPYSDKVVA